LNAEDIFNSGIFPYIAASVPDKDRRLYRHFGRDEAEETCFLHPVSRRIIFADILNTF